MYEFSTDINLMRWVLSTIFMMVLLMSFAFIVKYFSSGKHKSRFVKTRRMQLEETLHIDARHKIYLIKLDDVEHMVMVGGSGENLLHSQIAKGSTENDSQLPDENEIGFLKDIDNKDEQENNK